MANPMKRIIRDFSLAIDGVVFRGDCNSVGLPAITKTMEEYRGGGMDGSVRVSMGYEAKDLSFELTSNDPDVIRMLGLDDSSQKLFTVYTFMKDFNGGETGSKVECQGEVMELGSRELESGAKITLSFTVAVSYYRETQNGVLVLEHDPLNLVLDTGAGDVNRNRRALLGL